MDTQSLFDSLFFYLMFFFGAMLISAVAWIIGSIVSKSKVWGMI